MEIQRMKIDQLKLAPYNPRTMSEEEKEKLKNSILTFGYVEPLVWNKRTGNVVGGNQRLIVLKELGFKEVDVVVVDLDLKQEKILNIALNRIHGEWDYPKLKAVFEELDKNDWFLTGFDMDFIEDLLKDFETIEELPDDFELNVQSEKENELVFKVYCPVDRKEELVELLRGKGFKFKV